MSEEGGEGSSVEKILVRLRLSQGVRGPNRNALGGDPGVLFKALMLLYILPFNVCMLFVLWYFSLKLEPPGRSAAWTASHR